MNMVIYNHSRYLNIAFWGVVLGELISLAHDFHFTKGFCGNSVLQSPKIWEP